MHAVTGQIIHWAKRSALAAQRSNLTASDLLCGVYALRDDPAVSGPLASLIGASPTWPTDLVALFAAAEKVAGTDQKFPLESGLKNLIGAVSQRSPELEPAQLLPMLLDMKDPLVLQLERAAATTKTPADPPSVTARLESLLQTSARLTAALNREVLGQEPAVAMLADAYFQGQIAARDLGPRGIFTFLGPPGVGKTMLAERFARELAAIEGGDLAFRRFDMGTFAGHQAHEQLFGVAAFYKDSRPGTLTGFVKEHPKAVILFDEIEKAHLATIQSLLAVLDKGEAEDKSLEQVVSFREAWFVITTNLGQDLFSASNQAGILAGAGASADFLLDVLAADPTPNPDAMTRPPGLPQEFVSRLAKGGLVVLNRLETRHYLKLVERAFSALSDGAGPVPRVTVAEDVAFLLLLSLLPRIDARRVSSRAAVWSTEVVRHAWEACREAAIEAGPGPVAIDLCCGPQPRAWLDARLNEAPVRLVVVDDQDHVRALVTADSGLPGVEVKRVAAGDDPVGATQRFKADLVLLDLCIDEAPDSPRVDRGCAILEDMRARSPDVPIWLFAENAETRRSFGALVDRIMGRGGARGFLPCRRTLDNALEIEDFLARLRDVIEDLRYERCLKQHLRAHKNVSFRLAYRWEAAERRIVGEVAFAREEVVIGAADRRATVRFAGIPHERFSDIVGLARARRRLSQVVEWLKNPAALNALGAAPPRGFLLAGPPGTGKTLLARALAGEAGLPFLALAASELQSKWVGESEARIRELFARAREYAPAIVFIDEIDGIARARRGDEMQHTYSVLNQLLACMDGFKPGERPIFVLAATNHAEDLDAAILRPGRFDEIVPVDLPNAEARRRFFELRLRPVKVVGEVDLARLVAGTGGCSPAELDRIVREAIYQASSEGRDAIRAEDLEAASRLVRFGAESEEIRVPARDLRATACHEAGHAVVHVLLFPDRPVDWLTIVPSERGSLGFLATRPDEEGHSVTLDATRRRLAVLMAGREAERLCGGEGAVSAGARSDLLQATRQATAAVSEWGFDAVWGPVAREGLPPGSGSAQLDERVRAWVETARTLAERLLTDNRDLLDAVTEALLEAESLDGEDLAEILRGRFDMEQRRAAIG